MFKESVQLFRGEHAAPRQLFLHRLSKALFQRHQLKHVADVHDSVKFVLRDDQAKGPVLLGRFPLFVVVRKLRAAQLLVGGVAYVYLVGNIGEHIPVFPQMSGQFLQVPGAGVHNPLRSLGRAVI